MSADVITPLEGEPQIPGVAPAKAARSNSKQLIAVALLLLSVVAVLGFALSRYFGRSAEVAPKQTAIPDVASARSPALQMPAPQPVAPPASESMPAAVPQAATVVPSLAAGGPPDATAIALRGGQAASPTPERKVMHPDDAPIFSAGAAPSLRTGGSSGGAGAAAPRPTGDPVADANASLDAYQRQLAGMLENLQKLSSGEEASTALAPPTALPPPPGFATGKPNAAAPALFGSMDRSATPTVQARMLGDRNLIVPKGTLFLCSLKTRVVTATSGLVGCQVTRNVFSDNGRVLLIERGSHMDGEYRIVTVRPGMTRIPVLWTRVRTPHGVTVDLNSPATGELGESGLGGYVDNRWGERLGAAVLLSLIDDAIKYAIAEQTSSGGNNTVVLPSTAEQGSELAEKVLATTINIPPLLYQNQGGVVGVYVARDLDFSSVYELKPQ